ncbi:MAG: type II secretion system F family protein [Bacilli bacterium]|nr:type II secretion system F family protein [Bacilli bacterium]
MIESGNFNIYNTAEPTNKDLVVVFSPGQNITTYTYNIYKDNIVIETNNITTNTPHTFYLTETGTYKIIVNTIDNTNKATQINSGQYIIDKENPVITIKENNIKIKKGESINNIVSAKDNISGNLTNQIISNINDIDLNTSGKKVITYTVSDEAGNQTSENLNLTVADSNFSLYTIWTILLIIIVFIIYMMKKLTKIVNISSRIDPYIIKPNKEVEISILDKILIFYHKKLDSMKDYFNKSVLATKYSKKLEKYAKVSTLHTSGMQIFIGKIIAALIFVLIALFTRAIKFKLVSSYELLIPFTVGFFLPDIVYLIKYKAYRVKLENDLLSAIIIMNNAFKSGRSIIQAIDIVANETKGRMSKEFKKMSLELSYGLEIDTVFKRFEERTHLEEVSYLTASLTILNKTGGNIIEVFESIEKTMFNKKTLRLELKSLTSSSRIIVYALFTVPFLFILFISIISPGYFMPFIDNHLGRILLIIMVIYYLIFVYTVRKIMKVVI